MKRKIGIITSFQITHDQIFKDGELLVVNTPFGPVDTYVGEYGGCPVVHMTRSGRKHPTPPHLINHRGNISALAQLGVSEILSFSMVGSLNSEYKTGSLVIADQFLDFTKDHPPTLYSDDEFAFVDITEPFCPRMRLRIIAVCQDSNIAMHPFGCYACTNGPRFETKAEIKMFRILGGDLVGMTIVPECIYAREAGICYATVSGVVNMGAGIEQVALDNDTIRKVRVNHTQNMVTIIKKYLESVTPEAGCGCGVTSQQKEYRKDK